MRMRAGGYVIGVGVHLYMYTGGKFGITKITMCTGNKVTYLLK